MIYFQILQSNEEVAPVQHLTGLQLSKAVSVYKGTLSSVTINFVI